MRKMLCIFLLLLLVSCTSSNLKEVTIDTGDNKIKIKAEIADTYEEQTTGLMFRQSLPENHGMLFIFNDTDYRQFWMKNTLIPLDMVFIGENLEIVDIQQAVSCRVEPCTIYRSAKPAKYVLEVNINFANKNNISIGSKVKI